jgi:hypothetical protein
VTGTLEEVLAAKERTGALEASELAALTHLRELAEETGTLPIAFLHKTGGDLRLTSSE